MSIRTRLARLESRTGASADSRAIPWDWIATRRDDGYDPADVARWTAALYPPRPRGMYPIEAKIAAVAGSSRPAEDVTPTEESDHAE